MNHEVRSALMREFNRPDLLRRLEIHHARVAEAIARDRAGLPCLDYGDPVLNYNIARHLERDRRERGVSDGCEAG